jgi:hypothetical protein
MERESLLYVLLLLVSVLRGDLSFQLCSLGSLVRG